MHPCSGVGKGGLLSVVAADLTLPSLRALVEETLPECSGDSYESVSLSLAHTHTHTLLTMHSHISQSHNLHKVYCLTWSYSPNSIVSLCQ